MEKTQRYNDYSSLVRRHERLIVTLCLRYGGSADTPDDLAQEVRIGLWHYYCAMHRELAHWQEGLWVYWRTRSLLSHRNRRAAVELLRLNAAMLDSIAAADNDDAALLDELAECLDDDDRRILDLILQGYAASEIAQREGLTEVSVRQRRHRLVEKLRRRAEELGKLRNREKENVKGEIENEK